MPTVGDQKFPYTEEGMMDAEMAASGINPMQEGIPMGELPEQAEELAESGRGGDTIAAHLTVGEVVLPPEVAEQLYDQIIEIMGEENIGRITVGNPENSINPETGMPEFGFFSSFFGRSKAKRQARNAQREATRLYDETKRMIAQAEVDFRERMTKARIDMDEESAMFNKSIAEDQEKSRVMAIRRNRAFKKGLLGSNKIKISASKEARSSAEGSPQEFSAPSFFSSKRKRGRKSSVKGFTPNSQLSDRKKPR